ncbi:MULTISPECIES: fluoride efflux transporter CrcB [Halomonadaceae]|uniref:fluoride efflux transporter CrcB n=1 Tax=Halomonadaceae TaxID=28256 RepID=UPI00200BCB02|nr:MULTISPECIES: fluoride efflux transporter CrcB [unclassified Halomonas]
MSDTQRFYAAVALGSALGAIARYLVSIGLLSLLGPGYPWGTLVANVLGSVLIGLVSVCTQEGGRFRSSPLLRQFLMAGFCGGFTTFSIFSLEVVSLADQGEWRQAAGYVVLSLGLWMGGVVSGVRLGTRLNRRHAQASCGE